MSGSLKWSWFGTFWKFLEPWSGSEWEANRSLCSSLHVAVTPRAKQKCRFQYVHVGDELYQHDCVFTPQVWLTFTSNYTDNYLQTTDVAAHMFPASLDLTIKASPRVWSAMISAINSFSRSCHNVVRCYTTVSFSYFITGHSFKRM